MASSLKNLFGVKSKLNMNQVNGEEMNESEDPYALMNEFRSLYTEKLKAIEENCEDPTDAKVRTLQDWVNDLTEQNVTLVKIVEELEREALDRVNTFNNLAVEAKESIHQDVQSDLCQLLILLKRIREGEPYCACGLEFRTITYMDVFGCPPPPKTLLSPDDDCACSYDCKGDAICTKSDLIQYPRYKRNVRTIEKYC